MVSEGILGSLYTIVRVKASVMQWCLCFMEGGAESEEIWALIKKKN